MNAPLPPDPYKALGVELNADAAHIKTAYRKLVLKCHPDKFPDPTLKALKQEEFQRVQQAYEILGNEDRKREYDLEVQAKKLKDELNKRGGSTTNGPSGSRYCNVHVRTAEPPPGWSPSSKHSPPKSNSHKPYSGLFSQSWENEIPSRSKAHYDEGRTARRAASYEKPKREESRDRRRRFEEDRERERRREQEEEDIKRERRQKLAKERELREREAKERERERERARKAREREDRDSRAREHDREARLKADAKADKKLRERERAEREAAKRKQEAEEKTRAKTKPYVEHSGFSDDDDARKSPSKKPSKKHDSPTREKPSTKQRERLGSRDEGLIGDKNQSADDKLQSAMAFAAQYVQETKNKANKSPPKVAQDMPAYSAAYPDPNEKFAAAAKRRGSGDGKHVKGEPVNVDAPGPSKERPDTVNVPPTQQAPPRLQKSYTMPPGRMPQVQTAAHPTPPRGPPVAPGLNRSYTMQPDHFDGAGGRASGEKHRSSRRRASFNEDDYFDDRHTYQPPQNVRKFSVSRDKGAAPRTMETKYKDPYGPSASAPFSKVKTAPTYGPEHVSTAKRYGNDEVLTSDYMPPSYADYPTQAAY